MTTNRRNVRVRILGEEYNLRTAASQEQTETIAHYVDGMVRAVVEGAAVETHRAAILACLRIAAELFEAREASEALAGEMEALSREIRPWLPPSKRHE